MGSRPNSLLFYGFEIEECSNDWNILFEVDEEDGEEEANLDCYEVAEKLGDFAHVVTSYDESNLKIGMKISSGDWDADETISLKSVDSEALGIRYYMAMSKLPDEYQEMFKKYKPELKMSSYYC